MVIILQPFPRFSTGIHEFAAVIHDFMRRVIHKEKWASPLVPISAHHSPFHPIADQLRPCCYTEESATVYKGKRPCHLAHTTARVRRSSPNWRSSRSTSPCASRSS